MHGIALPPRAPPADCASQNKQSAAAFIKTSEKPHSLQKYEGFMGA
jgi:hypothetical protein